MPPKRRQTSAEIRLQRDYMRLKEDPFPYIEAEPLPENVLIWHYVLKGPKDTPYQGGYYHGKMTFPSTFPFKPPTITMITPNGRFMTNFPICLSITNYHPDMWNPSWWVGSILTGLLSFMLDDELAAGSVSSSTLQKQMYAWHSLEFNLKNRLFRELFPDICQEIHQLLLEPRPMPTVAKKCNENLLSVLIPQTPNSLFTAVFNLVTFLICCVFIAMFY